LKFTHTMNKLFITLALLTISVKGFSQQTFTIDEETKQAVYREVVEVPGATKAELYDRTLAWMNIFYPNPNGVIQTKNPETGEIVGKAQFKITGKDKKGTETYDGLVGYTITILFKDGKFKYDITRIHWKLASYYDVSRWMDTKDQYYKQSYVSYIEQTNAYFEKLKAELVAAVKSPKPKKSSDW